MKMIARPMPRSLPHLALPRARHFVSVAVVLAIAAGILARLWLSLEAPRNYDTDSYGIVAGIVARGGNVYAETVRYNYSPLWAYVLLALHHLAGATGLPPMALVRLLLSAADIANALLLGLIVARTAPGRGLAVAAAYLANPFTITVAAYHGQFEPLAFTPILLAVLLHLRRPDRPLWPLWALGLLSLLIKHIALFEVWLVLVYAAPTLRRAALAMAGAVAVFLLSFAPFVVGGAAGIVQNVFRYQSLAQFRLYGLSLAIPGLVVNLALYATLAAFPLLARRYHLALPTAIAMGGLLLLVLMPAISPQQAAIPILTAMVPLSPAYWLYTATAVPIVWGTWVAWEMPRSLLLLNLAWLGAAIWSLTLVLAHRRAHHATPLNSAPGCASASRRRRTAA